MAFSPDGRYLVTGRATGPCRSGTRTTGRQVGTLGTHDRPVRGVVFSRDGRHLASASGDGEVKLWDATRLRRDGRDGRPLRTLSSARSPGVCLNVAFSPDGRRLATGGEGNTVKIWDVETGKELRKPSGDTAGTSTPWPSAPTAGGSPRRARTAPSGCGEQYVGAK